MELFKYVLYLYACAINGEKPETVKEVDIRKIYSIAVKHGIWNMVFLSVQKLYADDTGVFNLTEEIYKKMEAGFKLSVFKNLKKWNALSEIISVLHKYGVNVCLLKGMTIGAFYSEPYARTTTDIDLLIDERLEKIAGKAMESIGFELKYRWEDSHHLKCVRPDIGLVELHIQLYDHEVLDVWFDAAKNKEYKFADFSYDTIKCKQLEYTEALIFNFLHFVKHYINGLVTIKHIMDIMVFLKHYRAEIDFGRINDVVEKLSYGKLFRVIKCIGVMYLGFTEEDLCEDESVKDYKELAKAVLADLYKYASTDTASIYNVYTESLQKQTPDCKQKKSDGTSKFKKIGRLLWADKRRMLELYSVLEKHMWLMPFLQIHRIFKRLFNLKAYTNKEKKKINKEQNNAQDRIQLIEKLGIM